MLDSNSDRLRRIIENDELYVNDPDNLLLSEKLSPIHSSLSFSEDAHGSFPLYRGKVSKILDTLFSYINQSTQALQDSSKIMPALIQARTHFFKHVEREVDREIHEKKYDIDRYKENLLYITNEFKNHQKSLTEAINSSEGPTDSFVNIIKERMENTIAMLNDGISRNYCFDLDLEIASKKYLRDDKEKIHNLEKEVENLKLRRHEMTPDTARIRPLRSPEGHDNAEEIDSLICQRIDQVLIFLQEFISLKLEKDSYRESRNALFSPNSDTYFHLKCFEQFRVLEQKIVHTLKLQSEKTRNSEAEQDRNYTSIKKISPNESVRNYEINKDEEYYRLRKEIENLNLSNLALNRLNHEQAQEIQEFKNKLSYSVQESSVLKQKYSALKAHENELSMALRNQEASFEEKLNETQNDMRKMHNALQRVCEDKNLSAKVRDLEEELRIATQIIESGSNASFERELETVRKIYNDKYEELFKLTSSQISDLEKQLLENNHTKQMLSDEVRNSVRREEQRQKEQEFQRLNQIHNRELRLIQSEFEDFLVKTKAEVGKLGKLVEKAITSSDVKLLGSVREDLQVFSNTLQSKSKKVKEESFSLSFDDERVCKRCGLNDNKSRFCAFHPYLVNADAQELLYGIEWHKCREAGHRVEMAPCAKTNKHCYSTENDMNFIKVLDGFHPQNLTFANSRSFEHEKVDTPSKTLQDALFSSSRKVIEETSATDLLDSYLNKYT